ncbi:MULTISPECIES: ATP-binding protein [Megasphaera]|jgi:DNA polymerase-3 subunit delta'|uniref:AAA family ATPase n=1 Tax=Megasphaera intestinihominis TaxID=3133159 RepID=A0ABV1CY68_9FIRM|nr:MULTISPECIES: AAA family ATPase [unclassified Megasphaera]MCH3902057.1 AAA family ATPase [Limosilactobacillus oris]MCI1888719.1 AAA family ATPase [Sporolactobacillus sp.]MCI1906499.1 AAA family ATPase [Enterococcaceae bacterium]MCH3930785.1 AAA family ATPase [Megasphaera sp.]MCH4174003.1 AAA family ATPase [Megasphaera sp.]
MMDRTLFDPIIGHSRLKEQFARLIDEDRIPHAMIFAGPAGIGKTLMAIAVASALVGRRVFPDLASREGEAVAGDKDDAFYLAPMGAMLKVDQFRQLQGELALQGETGRRRVCIIDHVETMNTEFANRMLKILEEPPSGVCFILITDQPDLLLPTIISRCARFTFDPVGDDEMRQGLRRLRGDGGNWDEAILWGGGIVRTVLSYLDGQGTDKAHFALDFLTTTAKHACPYAKWLALSAALTDRETTEILGWISLFLRDMAVLRSGAGRDYIRLKGYIHEMTELLPYWTDDAVFGLSRVLDEGLEAVSRHVNVRLVWDYVCLQAIRLRGGIQ